MGNAQDIWYSSEPAPLDVYHFVESRLSRIHTIANPRLYSDVQRNGKKNYRERMVAVLESIAFDEKLIENILLSDEKKFRPLAQKNAGSFPVPEGMHPDMDVLMPLIVKIHHMRRLVYFLTSYVMSEDRSKQPTTLHAEQALKRIVKGRMLDSVLNLGRYDQLEQEEHRRWLKEYRYELQFERYECGP
jgi:hypothetical protein